MEADHEYSAGHGSAEEGAGFSATAGNGGQQKTFEKPEGAAAEAQGPTTTRGRCRPID